MILIQLKVPTQDVSMHYSMGCDPRLHKNHHLLSAPWLRMQCDQMPQDAAAMTSLPDWIVSSKHEPFLPLNCFHQDILSQQQEKLLRHR